MNKILVSIVNYCDPEFYSTVKSLWDEAENKDRLYFSLVSEDNVEYDFSFIPNKQIIYRHFDTSVYRGGLCWARNLATKVDIDYEYFIQFDSHTYASKGWDDLAVQRYLKIKEKDSNFIIAYAPPDYEIMNNGDIDYNTGSQISMHAFFYTELVPGFKFPGYRTLEINKEIRTYWATCCYLFAPKKWVDEVGISPDESFNTEEFSLSLRTYSKNWKIYSVGTRDVFHHQSHRQPNGVVTRETLRPWADHRKEDYWSHVEKSTDRLSSLMSGNLDVPIDKVANFFKDTGISEKYLKFIPNYSSHVVIENRGFGMPPRKSR